MGEPGRQNAELTGVQFLCNLLKLACLAFGFWSCGAVVGGISLMIQTYFHDIPQGMIVRTEGAKGGIGVHLDNGVHTVFPNWFAGERKPVSQGVKLDTHGMLQLAPGDTVAKPRYSFVYSVNGAPLTDLRWEVNHCFLYGPERTMFVVFVILALAYACAVPGGDLLEFNKRPDPAITIRSIGVRGIIRKGFLRPMRLWLLGVVVLLLCLEIAAGCLGVVARAIAGKL